MYERGAGVDRDEARAADLYGRACEQGELRGCVNLGVLLEAGTGVNRDPERARELYARACDGGQALACDLGAALERSDAAGPPTYFKAGRVNDADNEAPIFGALLEVPSLGLRVISDDQGRVSLGRIPRGRHGIVVEAFGYEPVSGEVDAPGNAEFVVLMPRARFDDPLARGRIVGTIGEADGGRNLANVEIGVVGDSLARSLSNADGRFELRGLAPGLLELRLSRLGYATRTTRVVLQPGATVELSAVMSQQAIELEPIEVMVRSGYLDRSGFYRRAQQGWGTHFAPEDIERLDPFSAADLLRRRPVAGVRMMPDGIALSRRSSSFSSSSDAGNCILQVFLDGVPASANLEDIPGEWLDAVEVYQGVGTPIQYQFNNSCGVVLIWTTR
jgi:hypothetical protein